MPARAAAADPGHRLPADRLPVPARDRLRRLHPRRLPAGACWPKSTSRRCTKRSSRPQAQAAARQRPSRRGIITDAPERRRRAAARDEHHGARRRRLGHGAGRPRRGARTTSRCGRAMPRRPHALRAARAQRRYLPGVALPPALRDRARDLAAALRTATTAWSIVATPMAGLREHAARACRRGATPAVLWLCKGFEARRPARSATRSRARSRRRRASACCRGPSFAHRGRARPADRAGRRQRATRRCATPRSPPSTAAALRVYTIADLVGVEVGGAVKNVLAIATGIADGLALGLNARAALDHARPGRDDAPGRRARRAAPRPSWACRAWATWCSPPPATCRATARVGLRAGRRASRCAQSWPTLGHVAEGVRSAPMVLRARARAAASRCRSSHAVAAVLAGRARAEPGARAADAARSARRSRSGPETR